MNEKLVKYSKYLSKILRHNPERIGLHVDPQGWANIEDLLGKSKIALTREELGLVVERNDKQRFALSEDGRFIKANQGHSISIDLQLDPKEPPEILFHGTAQSNVDMIRASGLDKLNRHHVHLSADYSTAIKVGSRHGTPIVLTVRSGAMYLKDFKFYLSSNCVWLTKEVPPEFLLLKD